MDTLVRDGKTYGFEAFVLDPVRRALTRGSVPVALSATVFDTLLYLVEHPGRVVLKDELLDAVWARKFVEEANVSQTIYTLRKALAAAGAAEPIIVTAPGQGYRFALPVRLLDAASVAPARAGAQGSDPGDEMVGGGGRFPVWPRTPIQRVATFGALALLVASLAAGAWFWRKTLAPPPQGLVVLAEFENFTKDPVFDRTLAKALEVDLDQSPFVTALSDRQVQDTLELMTRPKDTPITPAVAAEVCVRNNGQAVVEGGIAALGAKYLLTLNATDCGTGQALAAEKAQVDGREAVIPALDRLIAQMREKLGESRAMVARFNVPLANEKTASLDAIKAYSEANYLANHGQGDEAAALFQRAVALDPNFAAAYASLAALEFNTGRKNAARADMIKAYALRDTVNEELSLNIAILYNSLVANDYNEVIRSARAMTDIYPRQGSAWINLSNAENWLGRYAPAVEAGRRAVVAAPRRESSYVVLARALMHAGRLDEAAAVCDQAAAKGLAGGQTAVVRLEVRIAKGDRAGVENSVAEARGKPFEADVLTTAARDAYRQGQAARGDGLYARVAALHAAQGEADASIAGHASDLSELGLADRARALIAGAPADTDPMTYLLTLATVGDLARATAILDQDLRDGPADTLLNAVLAPEIRATTALRAGQPAKAVAELQPALPYEARDNDAPYLRGRAYLAANDGARAAAEFHKILDHPGVEPADVQRPLAQLGLARALRVTHDAAASRRAYAAFLDSWRGADPTLPLLREARAEYAALRP